jgi:hypothetical protein
MVRISSYCDNINGPPGNLGPSILASAAGKPNIYLGLPYLGMQHIFFDILRTEFEILSRCRD